MITLFFDGVTAVVKSLDRLLTAVDGVRRPGGPLPVDDAQPAGAGPRPGTGGHPIESTSELLAMAATEIQDLARMSFTTPMPWVEGFAAELRDRAAQLFAAGD